MNILYKDMARLAKRDNNTKRPFLLVNPLQGKHMPVSPNRSLQVMHSLARKLQERYKNEKLLIIGFAETATAIGAALSTFMDTSPFYIHTTREPLSGHEYLFFTESHSHATDQKLIKDNLEEIFSKTERVIFAEDEVTTGNTIEKIIALLQKEYKDFSLKFGIASLLNGMTQEKIQELQDRDIPCDYLFPAILENYENVLDKYFYNNSLQNNHTQGTGPIQDSFETILFNGKTDPRLGVLSDFYLESVKHLYSNIKSTISFSEKQKILILGTEEFMFPALYAGSLLEKDFPDSSFMFHATTRSPILTSDSKDYPIRLRYELNSFYDNDRTTYIYNIENYDMAFIITDSNVTTHAIHGLVSALMAHGNPDIYHMIWSE